MVLSKACTQFLLSRSKLILNQFCYVCFIYAVSDRVSIGIKLLKSQKFLIKPTFCPFEGDSLKLTKPPLHDCDLRQFKSNTIFLLGVATL